MFLPHWVPTPGSPPLPARFTAAVEAGLLSPVDPPVIATGLGLYHVDATKVDTRLTTVDSSYDGLRDVATKLGLDLTLPR